MHLCVFAMLCWNVTGSFNDDLIVYSTLDVRNPSFIFLVLLLFTAETFLHFNCISFNSLVLYVICKTMAMRCIALIITLTPKSEEVYC